MTVGKNINKLNGLSSNRKQKEEEYNYDDYEEEQTMSSDENLNAYNNYNQYYNEQANNPYLKSTGDIGLPNIYQSSNQNTFKPIHPGDLNFQPFEKNEPKFNGNMNKNNIYNSNY